MATYRVVDYNLVPVIQHIESYKLKVTNMVVDGNDYVITTDGPISESEIVHLNEGFGVVEVI
jgi:hypothetical protein